MRTNHWFLLLVLSLILVAEAEGQGNALRFKPLNPCRVADTRISGTAIQSASSRDFQIAGVCGVPSSAAAYSLNVTAIPPRTLGYISVWPKGQQQPLVSTLNSLDGRIKANAAILPAGDGGAISVYATDITDIVLDVNGYFVDAATDTSALAFFALPPCRIADTRNPTGPLGGPSLAAAQPRTVPVRSSSCNIPAVAQAYSLNFTVVPQRQLGYLSTWPTGASQPLVSTLNALTGTLTANAAIVPAGVNGSIDVYATDASDLIVDINGYFAPSTSDNDLSLYTLPPCRLLDTRIAGGSFLGQKSPNEDTTASPCGLIPSAEAVVLNATVVPAHILGYLSLWPGDQSQPLVSTLNALDGFLTSNMAVVPTSSGVINAYVTDRTDLILDTSGYFAKGTGPAPTTHTLTVNRSGAGTGTVSSFDGKFNCGPVCSVAYLENTSVILTASPTAGSSFAGWSGAGCSGATTCTVTLASSAAVTATFTPPPPHPQTTLTSILVTPLSPTLAKGRSQQFTATGLYSDNATQDLTTSVVWTVEPAGIVSINSSGFAQSVAEGQALIMASSSSVVGISQLLVGPPQVVTMVITAPSSMILGDVAPLTATGTFTDGSVQDVSNAAQWTASNPYVVSISTSSGVRATAKQVGLTTLAASVGAITTTTPSLVVRGYPRFAYVANELADSVSTYTVDPVTGMLRANGYAFTRTTALTNCFTVDPSRSFGYAVNFSIGGQNGAQPSISLFNLGADGSLTSGGADMTVGANPGCVAISPSGKFAFIPFAQPDAIGVYTIDAFSHALTQLSNLALPRTPWNLALDPTGRFLYIAFDSGVFAYSVDGITGALTAVPGSPFPTWTNGNNIAIEPSGRFAYISNPSDTRIKVYSIAASTGALAEVQNATISSGGINPSIPVFDPGGQFLFVANELASLGAKTGAIGAFRIDAATGKLTPVPGSPFAAGKDAQQIAIDGLGKYLYVNDGGNFVAVYEIDAIQGSLRNVGHMATRSGLNSLTVVSGSAPIQYVPTLAWVLDQAGSIQTFAFDSTAALKSVATKNLLFSGATSFAVDQNAKWGYSANPSTNRLDTYKIDPSGILSDFVSFDFAGRSPTLVTTDSNNLGIYVTDAAASAISGFSHLVPAQINPFSDQDGTLVKLIPAGPSPAAMVIDPNSEYLFVANGNSTLSRYALAPGYGYPAEITWLGSPSAFAPGVKAMAIDRTGAYLYAISNGQLSGYWLDYFNQALPTAITNFPAINLNSAAAIATNVRADCLYVADSGGVHGFTIDPATGQVTAQGPAVPAGSSPTAMAVDSAGSNLLVVDSALGVQVFTIDAVTGSLTQRTTIVSGTSPVSIAVSGTIQ